MHHHTAWLSGQRRGTAQLFVVLLRVLQLIISPFRQASCVCAAQENDIGVKMTQLDSLAATTDRSSNSQVDVSAVHFWHHMSFDTFSA